jgi:hypothetical protein
VGALETVEDQVKPELVLVAVVAAGLKTCSMASPEPSPDFRSYSAQAVNPEAAEGRGYLRGGTDFGDRGA